MVRQAVIRLTNVKTSCGHLPSWPPHLHGGAGPDLVSPTGGGVWAVQTVRELHAGKDLPRLAPSLPGCLVRSVHTLHLPCKTQKDKRVRNRVYGTRGWWLVAAFSNKTPDKSFLAACLDVSYCKKVRDKGRQPTPSLPKFEEKVTRDLVQRFQIKPVAHTYTTEMMTMTILYYSLMKLHNSLFSHTHTPASGLNKIPYHLALARKSCTFFRHPRV